ncbi:TlpA family protein disulfide reductase [Acidiphilium sp. AL]|uniref:TlpA family protein disulfide reductase n=1 Tax=Acidiphilium iwatense TaxID=768198 RepID=A0ABS9DVG2_9PROT|nr:MULTISPECIES: TlpA disulfide reductase family protein [Acidiphilium]MCF3946723.1 TlpA family protein disulfide reductase [Acidiphilium iwatense]MCU4158694.1 TlpA family protein disulfide reductase [Acidiphilium sp. AL]
MALTLSRRHFAAIGAGLAAPGLASLAGFGKSARASDLPDAAGALGEIMPVPPPPFHFMNAGGRRLTLAHYRGEGLVVNFWATWCGPCTRELPTLAALNKVLLPDGIRVLPISVDSSGARAVEPYYAKHHIEGLPVLVDPSSSALAAFHVDGIPLTVLIDRKGDMVARLEGAGDWNTPATAAKVRRLVGGAKPPVTQT